MHPSPFPQTSGSSGSRPANLTRSQTVPTTGAAGEADSWIEVASHPSDSTYTSSSDERIITAGLQISATRRRHRSTFRVAQIAHPEVGVDQESDGGLSEEEDEGEDMGSMINEMPVSSDGYSSPDDDEEDSDDEASVSDAPAPRTVFSASSQQRPSQATTPAVTSRRHGPGGFNMFAPNHATDHDEALRASLSTLLSCAAAARGLPKPPPQSQTSSQAQQTSTQQSGRLAVEGIRVVREGNLPSEASGSVNGKSRRGSMVSTTDSTSSALLQQSAEGKQKRSASKRKTKSWRRSHARARGDESELSALGVSYATLAFSAGAIVLLSAITFSAGYAMGREVGKSEGGLFGSITGGSGRGKAVVRGLGRAAGEGGLRGAGRGISMGGGVTSVTA